jgi:hypothetical protein
VQLCDKYDVSLFYKSLIEKYGLLEENEKEKILKNNNFDVIEYLFLEIIDITTKDLKTDSAINNLTGKITKIYYNINDLYNYRERGNPFIYIHLVYITSFIYLTFFSVYISLTYNQIYIIQDLLLLIVIILNNFCLIGIRILAIIFINPYGEKIENIPVLYLCETTILKTKYICECNDVNNLSILFDKSEV